VVAKKRLKIINGSPEAVNRKTWQKKIKQDKPLHRKLNNEQHESHKKVGVSP